MKKPKTSKTSSIFLVTGLVVAAFLLLPVLFSDEPAKVFLPEGDGEAGALPVIVSENPLSKYLRQAKKFYNLDDRNKTAFGRARGVLPPPPQDIFTEEERAELLASFARERITAKKNNAEDASYAEGGIINGVVVQPDDKGYYYGDTYYRNGTYPSAALKKSIENSIRQFHEAQAHKQGKSAAYVLQDDGALIVKYLPKKDLDAMRFQKNAEEQKKYEDFYAASGSKYSGAKIASKNAPSSRGDSAPYGGGGVHGGYNSGGVDFANIDAVYAAAGKRYADGTLMVKPEDKTSPAREQQSSGEEEQKNSKDHNHARDADILKTIDDFDRRTFFDPWRIRRDGGQRNPVANREARIKGEWPMVYRDEFDGALTYVDGELIAKQLRAVGLSLNDIKNKNVRMADLGDTKAVKDITGTEENVKLFGSANMNLFALSGLIDGRSFRDNSMGRSSRTNSTKRTGNSNNMPELPTPKDNVFTNFLTVPAYDPAQQHSNTPFTDIYFEGTGLGAMLDQMEISPEKIEKIRGEYLELDAFYDGLKKDMRAVREKNPGLANLDVEFYYLLGKEGDKVVVATIKSPLYAANPGFAPSGDVYQNAEEAYVRRGVEELRHDLTENKLAIPFIVGSEDKTVFGKNATAIDKETLSSTSPAGLIAVGRKQGKAVKERMMGILSDQELEKAAEQLRKEREQTKKEEAAKKAADAKKAALQAEKTAKDLGNKNQGVSVPGYIYKSPVPGYSLLNQDNNGSAMKGPLMSEPKK